MYHVRYAADQVDGVEHVYCLGTVGKRDGYLVAFAYPYGLK